MRDHRGVALEEHTFNVVGNSREEQPFGTK
jgi:hypothetical protein